MGYVAVQGGTEAIRNSLEYSRFLRVCGQEDPVSVAQIREQMRLLVDRVMGEGGIYAPFHAALAIKQAEGDSIEASFFLRAYRSTLRRIGTTYPLDTVNMRLVRRISSAFKDIPGGQILGPTPDYSLRILDFSLCEETREDFTSFSERFRAVKENDAPLSSVSMEKVVAILRKQGLVREQDEGETEPVTDITEEQATFPMHRSGRLQSLSRGETGGVLALAYSSMTGYGSVHPTIAELRVGRAEARIEHPFRPGKTICIGEILLTEVEIVAKFDIAGKDKKPYFTLGYGACFGHNELKAISNAVLDCTMKAGEKEKEQKAPAEDQEYVVKHVDGIEASGFCAHFKLPHYVTFQSALDRIRGAQGIDRKSLELDLNAIPQQSTGDKNNA